ncbi:zinc transporter ZntB [Tropicibacter naphthalenivorans]|uniref:Zinc transport protein ZntB n=1 Tax=Tropicibacter naphthalenivorans TaxID=441103 RepID=A0A0P1GBW7_9RHOB|nr:zinc transporter ZntB [Tropicibacter naphthalenivorans]CUH78933.1 Zinc transport protein ZntB [Tropicibacter naphthalenivorans]SMD10455.1 zinc transporter [Tropicibacter naphthalenivorans]
MTNLVPALDALISTAHVLDGPEACRRLTAGEAPSVLREDTLAWVHLHAQHPEAPQWIIDNLSYLDPTIVDALVAEETRPRVTRVGDGLIVILRGINMNQGDDPEDMVSIRLWVDPNRIISLSRRRVRAVEDIAAELDAGQGPRDAADFVVRLTERLNYRIEDFWRQLEDEADALEEEVLTEEPPHDLRPRLVELRRRAIILRRYLQPQRDAMRTLQAAHPDWLEEDDLRALAEELDALERVVEDADAMRDRMALVRDELAGQLSDRLNRNMYLLSILSALFLPLGFLTGLFGINVAGLPGSQTDGAFWLFSGGLFVVFLGQLVILRKLRWI